MSNTSSNPALVAILAGGKAKRFGGQDKGEILIEGQRLIDTIHKRLEAQTTKIIISGPHDYGLGLDSVADHDDALGGPVGGLYSIWKTLSSRNVEGFFTVAVDGPNLPDDLIGRLYHESTSTIAVDEAGRHPTYGWWHMHDLSKVWDKLDYSESISLKRLADLVNAKEVPWEGHEIFTNINRPADLENYIN